MVRWAVAAVAASPVALTADLQEAEA